MTVSRGQTPGERPGRLGYAGRVVLALLFCGPALSRPEPAPAPAPLSEVRARVGRFRPGAPMLTIADGYAPCATRADSLTAIPRTTCPPPRLSPRARRRVTRLSARASAAAQASADPRALHAAALLDVVFAGDAELDRPIGYLRTAARLSEHPSAPLADLAAALLIQAERTQEARYLFQALDAASAAVRADPANPAARFNLALALDRLHVDGQAAAAWRAFGRSRPAAGWSAEAAQRAAALARRAVPPAPPPPGASPAAEFTRFAAAAPQAAREWGWRTLLGGWGGAHLAGRADSAAALLRGAELLGSALERQGGDATLADAVRAVRASSASERAALARAHVLWTQGRNAYDIDVAAARPVFERVLRLNAPSPALNRWARLYRATGMVAAADPAAPDSLTRIIHETEDARAAALRAAVLAVLGTAALRNQDGDRARRWFGESAALARAAGEREGWGRGIALMADAEFQLGASRDAQAYAHQALALLHAYPRSNGLHNTLSVLGEELAREGLVLAAAHFYDEDVAVTLGHPNAIHAAEARIYRAELRAAVQDLRGAAVDYRVADSLVRTIPPGQRRMWIEGDALAAHAATLVRGDPRRAAALLDSALALPDSAQTPIRRLDARVGRAEARLAVGDVRGASVDLDHATLALRRQHDGIESEFLRASLLDRAAAVFDRMVMLQVNAGRPADALRTVERGRASLAPPGARASSPGTGLRAPPGEAVLEYALIGDTLLAWSLQGNAVRFRRSVVDRDSLLRDVQRARALLESGAPGGALLPALGGLYDLLVRPLAAALGPPDSRVVIIADGELGAVPFAALYDTVRRRFLVQDYAARYAARLDEALAPARPRTRGAPTVLLAAGPASVPEYPELQPLGEIQHEVAAVSGFYPPTATVRLEGRGATGAALLRALRGASVLHFAGHALADDARPGESSLFLAPDSGAGSGRLTAEALGRADLRHLRLVVLSACETLPARDGRSGGVAGFSGALLAAGVQGVVGSTWRVNDRYARELMVPFHRFYSRSGDGPAALRQAQLQLLASRDPLLRSPAAWAGFRYAGT